MAVSPAASERNFGPTALATPANAVTVGRLVFSPVLFVLIARSNDSWPALVLWIALAVTDGVDGWLARRHGATHSGAFLDPLADKALVLGALAALVVRGRFWWVPVALIAARELGMSAYRAWAGRRGVSVPARPLAKTKTVVQEVAVGFALLPLTAGAGWPATTLLWVAVVLTVWSGLQYVVDAQRAASAVS